jgi:Bacterial Ig-like domain
MTPRSIFQAPAALMVACAMLVGCGGGDAEAPPPPVAATPAPAAGAGPDTTAPTVTIANDTSAPTASGPVTFTFVFSEDVGITFEASDIVVTGGTAGAFVRISGSQATLVVTPPANSAGTFNVSVPAGRFSDLTGNANTAAATASKSFDVRLPTAPTTAAATPPTRAAADVLSIFSDAYAPIAGIDLNPNWGQSTVPSTVTVAGNAVRKYETLNYQGIDWAGNPINVSSMTRLHIDIWTPNVTSVLVSIISAGAENAVTLTPTLYGWNSFDIDLAQYTAANKNAIIQIKIEGTPAGGTLFFDNLYFWKPASAGGATSTGLLSFDEATAPKLTDFGTNGAPPVIATDPTGGTNKVLKVTKYALPAPGSEQWAGVTVSTGANDSIAAIPFTAAAKTITMRVYSPAVGVRVRLKVENAGNGGVSVETDALTTTSGAWETLSFNFANPGLSPPVGGGPTAALDLAQTYNKLSIFSDFGIGNGGSAPLPADRVYYYDDIRFVSGTGGGSASSLNFSTGFAAGNRTIEGGAYFAYSGSNQDSFNCTGGAGVCGSGNGGSGATSFFFAYYQTPTPATALFNGISVLAPGVTILNTSGDTAGVQINGQTTVDFTFNNNPEWQASGTNNFGVVLTLGKYYNVGTAGAPAACNIKLLAVVTPLNGGNAAPYAVPLNSFSVIQGCGTGINTAAAALASAPVAEVAFQAAGGTAALPTVGGKTTGANLSVAANGVYPTTLALTGGISFKP